MSREAVLPCQKNAKCRIEVRVIRKDPSKGKGTVGKLAGGVTVRLKEKGKDAPVATTTTKSGSSPAVFETRIAEDAKYEVEMELTNDTFLISGTVGKTKTLDVPDFAPPKDIGKVFTTMRKIAEVNFY